MVNESELTLDFCLTYGEILGTQNTREALQERLSYVKGSYHVAIEQTGADTHEIRLYKGQYHQSEGWGTLDYRELNNFVGGIHEKVPKTRIEEGVLKLSSELIPNARKIGLHSYRDSPKQKMMSDKELKALARKLSRKTGKSFSSGGLLRIVQKESDRQLGIPSSILPEEHEGCF